MGPVLPWLAWSPGGVGMLSIPVSDCELESVLTWGKHTYSYFHEWVIEGLRALSDR